jgi:hypothetical protein
MSTSNQSKKWIIAGVAGLVLVVLGCCALVGGVVLIKTVSGDRLTRQTSVSTQTGEAVQLPTEPEPSETEQPAPAPSETPVPDTPTVEVLPSAAPTEAEATATPPAQLIQIDYAGVAFSFDPSIAASAEHETVEAVTSTEVASWEQAPQYTVFTLSGYPLTGTFHQPQIFIYPVQDYLTIVPTIGDSLANLQQMLIEKSTAQLPENLPFFQNWNAGQMMYAGVKFLDFKNGSGVRYLTQYGQSFYPINNTDMFYTFQGLTSNGKYLVSAVLPVSNPILPDPETMLQDPKFTDQYESYIAGIKKQLNEQPDASFQPGLSLLDQMMNSLEIK